MKCQFCLVSILLLSLSFACGCAQCRMVVTPEVPDIGEKVTTRNKYRLIKPDELRTLCEREQPGVFASDGIPFLLQEGEYRTIDSPGAAMIPYFMLSGFSILTIPLVDWSEKSIDYTIRIGDRHGEKCVFDVGVKGNNIASLSPLALLFPYGTPPPTPGRRNYVQKYTNVFPGEDDHKRHREEAEYMTNKAIAYGVAVKLKEMEDSGKIVLGNLPKPRPAAKRPLAMRPAVGPSAGSLSGSPTTETSAAGKSYYRIINCERESGSDFAYSFVLEMTDEAQRSLRAFRTIQREFRAALKEDYVEAFALPGSQSLYVDFPVYRQNEGKIVGRAVVLTMSVHALEYDPETRIGRLSVKVNANQFEEARAYVRKNIETLARDKNIALVTGEIPPAAKFYLGREEIKDGNILEIEFKTE